MAFRTINRARLFLRDTGEPTAARSRRRPIVFVHGLLWNHTQWEHQVTHLRTDHRCVAYDHRGQGESEVPSAPLVDLETLYFDLAGLIEGLEIGPCHVVGNSMGGAVAIRLAARRPDLVESLTLVGTTPEAESPERRTRYRRMNLVARFLGPRPIAGRLMSMMFSEAFLQAPERAEERDHWRDVLLQNDRSIHRAVRGYLYRPAVTSELHHIEAPTRVVHATDDAIVEMSNARTLAAEIPDAEFRPVSESGHMLAMERFDELNELLDHFLGSVERSRSQPNQVAANPIGENAEGVQPLTSRPARGAALPQPVRRYLRVDR